MTDFLWLPHGRTSGLFTLFYPITENFLLRITTIVCFSNKICLFKKSWKVLSVCIKNYDFGTPFLLKNDVLENAKKAVENARHAFWWKFKNFDQTACSSMVFFTLKLSPGPMASRQTSKLLMVSKVWQLDTVIYAYPPPKITKNRDLDPNFIINGP